MNLFIFTAANGGNPVARGTTTGPQGNSYPVVITQGAAALHQGTQYHIALNGPTAQRSAMTFTGIDHIHNFA